MQGKFLFSLMNQQPSKLRTFFLGIISLSLLAIAIRQYLPTYLPSEKGVVVDARTGKPYVYDPSTGKLMEE
jgi:hypothetical protein